MSAEFFRNFNATSFAGNRSQLIEGFFIFRDYC